MSCTWTLQPPLELPSSPSPSATCKQTRNTSSFSITSITPPLCPRRRATPEIQVHGTATLHDQSSDLAQNEAPFEFPVEVERMVSELCSSSKESPPTYESFGLSVGIGLDYGGLHFNDSISAPPTPPAKQRSPFSLLQVPQQVPPPPPIPVRAAAEVQPIPTQAAFHCAPGLRFSEPSPTPIRADPPPANLPYFPESYPFPNAYHYAGKSSPQPGVVPTGSILTELPLPDGDTSFRELVVKGCLELESILRVHKQHSYIGDLLTFCHAIRESAAAAAGGEFDAPSDETRALIIAFFRLVSCWLGLFPCQQELHSAFREWQQASRRVIVAILRRVPALQQAQQHARERLLSEGDQWRPQHASPAPPPPSRQVWPKGQAKGPGKNSPKTLPQKSALRGPASKDWSELARVDGTRPGPNLSRSTTLPPPAWRAEDTGADANQVESRASTRLMGTGTGPPPSLDSTFAGGGAVVYPLSFSESATPQRPIGSAKASRSWRSPPVAETPRTAGRHHAPVVRFDLDGSDEVHHGAYMKPGCYDVPMRQSTPPAAPAAPPGSPLESNAAAPLTYPLTTPALPPLLPASMTMLPPPLLSETTWQAALASAETLSKALQSHEDAGREDGAVEQAIEILGFVDGDAMSHAGEVDDPGGMLTAANPQASRGWLPLAQLEVAEQLVPTSFTVNESRAKDFSSRGKKVKPRAGASSSGRVTRVVGRSRSWSRGIQSCTQASAPQLSPTTARKAKDILGALYDLHKAEDTEFEEGAPFDLDSMSQKLECQAYETLDQFEQDFRRVLFNHTNCSGDSAKVCAGRTKALEKVFDDLLEHHFCSRNLQDSETCRNPGLQLEDPDRIPATRTAAHSAPSQNDEEGTGEPEPTLSIAENLVSAAGVGAGQPSGTDGEEAPAKNEE
ncbi:uncharacterized protein LOC113211331 isoform X1 [Frankliniella occidentalis]|uniref:Uncharacterized protein LOC113211331 isoform X1 n=1 Tax=Frankliniella occidentalis TaxID=133901 RepID=A0A9C6U3U7_FRAOC|nr:uncharacterized protein LOC113211331 isoform X1 [Frankliniella occidentalis]XP_052120868.1 uncharacterized protein LOC113211331 isoform X1 [Frankliniella occidentalis]